MTVVEIPKFAAVVTTLANNGIHFPLNPHGGNEPGPYLARGESQMDHLLGKPTFRPHCGRDWRYGVFLGDNARPLMTGIYFIFDRRAVEPTTGWKVANSPEMEEEIVRMAQKLTPPPKLNTYGGYTEVASELHRRFPFYYPEEGVATLPWEIPVRAAKLILVRKDILSNYRKEIPDSLKEKVLPF